MNTGQRATQIRYKHERMTSPITEGIELRIYRSQAERLAHTELNAREI